MYIPSHFKVEDRSILDALVAENSFGTLVTVLDGVPFASHLPFLLDPLQGPNGTLSGHMARANPQWRQFEQLGEVLAIFQGPHGYISPSWYETALSVPTWNYTAVHVYGVPTLVEGDDLIAILHRTVALHEESREKPWRMDSLPEEYIVKMARAVTGFEIEITRVEGKFKLSQNRPDTELENVIAELERSGMPGAEALAQAMSLQSR